MNKYPQHIQAYKWLSSGMDFLLHPKVRRNNFEDMFINVQKCIKCSYMFIITHSSQTSIKSKHVTTRSEPSRFTWKWPRSLSKDWTWTFQSSHQWRRSSVWSKPWCRMPCCSQPKNGQSKTFHCMVANPSLSLCGIGTRIDAAVTAWRIDLYNESTKPPDMGQYESMDPLQPSTISLHQI